MKSMINLYPTSWDHASILAETKKGHSTFKAFKSFPIVFLTMKMTKVCWKGGIALWVLAFNFFEKIKIQLNLFLNVIVSMSLGSTS